jgi:hypothetical protein
VPPSEPPPTSPIDGQITNATPSSP